jgi:predicted RNase H-like HicB family nuclease
VANHDEILAAAQRIGRERRTGTFTPDDIVRALPHLNPGTIRTHVTSRCCVNAPKNHPHKWDYFRRVARATYEVAPKYRGHAPTHSVARETHPAYGTRTAIAPRHTVHALVTRGGGWFSAECLEIAVVTQGRTLDETVANLCEAILLHLDGENAAAIGLAAPLTLAVTWEEPLGRGPSPSTA